MRFCKILACILFPTIIEGCNKYIDSICVKVAQPISPVLSLKDYNLVQNITLIRQNDKDYKIDYIEYELETNINHNDIVSTIFYENGEKANDFKFDDNSIKINLNKLVNVDTLRLWLAVNISDVSAKVNNRLKLKCKKISTDRGFLKIDKLTECPSLRTGVALRKSGQDSVNTSRIPGLVTSKKGTLIVLYDARREKEDDLQGDIDIAINRSEDKGCTWEPMKIVLDMGKWGNLPEKYNGVSDASILSNDNNGDIIIIGLWMHGVLDPKNGKWIENLCDTSTVWNHQWKSYGSQPGYNVKQSSQVLLTRSSDDGHTWSKPINITKQIKKKEWWLIAPAPGRGITMKNGTLVFPVEGRDAKGLQFSTIIWSKDNGSTWNVGNPAYYNTNECQVVELTDHSLMLNMRERSNRGKMINNGRAIAVSEDLGKTWKEHSTSRKSLIEPACQASLLRHDYYENGQQKHVLLFANPNSKQQRKDITIKVSFDDGKTWPEDYWTLLDEGFGAGYSCMTSIDTGTIGIFYEGSGSDILFQAISLNELIDKNKK